MHDGGLYRFCYTHGARQADFRPFSGMDSLEQIYESEELFPMFKNRLLPPSRPEYDDYLRWSGFDPDNPPEPIVLLGVTEGIRQTDAVEVFPCPAPDAYGCFLNRFFLHGIRWITPSPLMRIDTLDEGEILQLVPEVGNVSDPNAVTVCAQNPDATIGYVPRYLARDVRHLLQHCDVEYIQLSVDRVNRDAPLQNRVLCRMEACWPDGFKPCSGEEFLPIPANAPARCS
jgi:hypothetical protein